MCTNNFTLINSYTPQLATSLHQYVITNWKFSHLDIFRVSEPFRLINVVTSGGVDGIEFLRVPDLMNKLGDDISRSGRRVAQVALQRGPPVIIDRFDRCVRHFQKWHIGHKPLRFRVTDQLVFNGDERCRLRRDGGDRKCDKKMYHGEFGRRFRSVGVDQEEM